MKGIKAMNKLFISAVIGIVGFTSFIAVVSADSEPSQEVVTVDKPDPLKTTDESSPMD